jgi:hypothetical protein
VSNPTARACGPLLPPPRRRARPRLRARLKRGRYAELVRPSLDLVVDRKLQRILSLRAFPPSAGCSSWPVSTSRTAGTSGTTWTSLGANSLCLSDSPESWRVRPSGRELSHQQRPDGRGSYQPGWGAKFSILTLSLDTFSVIGYSGIQFHVYRRLPAMCPMVAASQVFERRTVCSLVIAG